MLIRDRLLMPIYRWDYSKAAWVKSPSDAGRQVAFWINLVMGADHRGYRRG